MMIERTPDGHTITIGTPPRPGAYVSEAVLAPRDAWHTLPANYDGRRRDLRESLETYASRLGVTAAEARPYWRAEALRLLNVAVTVPCPRLDESEEDLGGPSDCWVCQGSGFVPADVVSGLCAIAPGVAVPTAFVDWPDDYPGSAP